jgi:hypothetical protein
MAVLVCELPKEERMCEVERIMKAFDLDIRDWISTIAIGKAQPARSRR